MSNRIVVGVDGSEQSREALRWATRMAQVLSAELEAVFAWADPLTETYVAGWGYHSADVDPVAAAENYLWQVVEETYDGKRPEFLTTVTVEGSPAKVLMERSRDATMLVVGSRGHGGFVGLLLGSVSAKCAEHASCPVLVVHGASVTAPDAAPPR